MMDISTLLPLLKARMGITSNVRDGYLTALLQGVCDELENEKGISLDPADMAQALFVVDYADFRYHAREGAGALPRHLQWRLHNLFLHCGGEGAEG